MRKLVTIQKIEDIQPIDGADMIEKIKVLGWWVVAQKSIGYQVGDLVVYHEIDSFLPTGVGAYEFLIAKSSRQYNETVGHVLRTISLRGQISQGFCVPFYELFQLVFSKDDSSFKIKPKGLPNSLTIKRDSDIDFSYEELIGLEVTDLLGVVKYEKPVPASISGEIKGNFPSWCPKTDEERVQNLVDEVMRAYLNNTRFEVTIKLDGTSCSIGKDDVENIVCSRNWSLKTEQEGNTLVDTAKTIYALDEYVNLPAFTMLQGELMGEGIQSNQEKIKGHKFFIYKIYDGLNGKFLEPLEAQNIAKKLGLLYVPVLFESVTLKELGFTEENLISDILAFADGESYNPKAKREGVVFKSSDGKFSFKAISNKWLLKNQD